MTKVICPEPGSQLTIGSVTAPMTEPTPRTDTVHPTWPCGHQNNPDNVECWICGKAKNDPQSLERSLARKEALLRHWVRLLRSERPTTITSALIAEIERELEGK
jgi:hypothetical protein